MVFGQRVHFSPLDDKISFTDSREVQSGLKLASKAVTQVKAKGDVKIMTSDGNQNKSIKLENTLYIPDLKMNLISVAKLSIGNVKFYL